MQAYRPSMLETDHVPVAQTASSDAIIPVTGVPSWTNLMELASNTMDIRSIVIDLFEKGLVVGGTTYCLGDRRLDQGES